MTWKLTKTVFYVLGEVTLAKLDMFIIVVEFNHNQSKNSVDGSVAVEAAPVAIVTSVKGQLQQARVVSKVHWIELIDNGQEHKDGILRESYT